MEGSTEGNRMHEAGPELSKHLPLLLNPLVNSIFNCPDPAKSPLRKLFAKLNDIRERGTNSKAEQFLVLVPPTFALLHFTDLQSGQSLEELSRSNQVFVASHILLLNAKSPNLNNQEPHAVWGLPQEEFLTLNAVVGNKKNQSVVIDFDKNTVSVSLATGWPYSKRLRILKITYMHNFNDYFKRVPSDIITLIHVDQPIVANELLVKNDELSCFKRLTRIPSIQKLHRNSHSHPDRATLPRDTMQQNRASFTQVLRLHDTWSKTFQDMFDEFRTKLSTLEEMVSNFNMIINETYAVMCQDPLFGTYVRNGSLRRLIYEHVESNLFKHIWEHLVDKQSTSTREELFYKLKYLSLDQLETSLHSRSFNDFKLSLIVQLESNLQQATKVFQGLSTTKSFTEKAEVLTKSLQILSTPVIDRETNSEITIDADSLIGLLVLIISRTKLRHLDAHLTYLQNFQFTDCGGDSGDVSAVATNSGMLGYSISTLEAVLYYIDHAHLKSYDKQTGLLLDRLMKVLQPDNDNDRVNVADFKSVLRYRSEFGESILCLAIKNAKNDFLLQLLTDPSLEDTFPMDDLIDDQTLDGSTLLMEALKSGNGKAARILLRVFRENCTDSELLLYFNRVDKFNRNVTHCITGQELDILDEYGHLFNWTHRDITGRTPLFTVFRFYDQSNYDELVLRAFQLSKVDSSTFNHHTDLTTGNTLLHILKANISMLLDLDIDVNQKNKNGLTPLMVYIKYGRRANVEQILNDRRLNYNSQFDLRKYAVCFDYARDPAIIELLAKFAIQNTTVFQHCKACSMRHCPTKLRNKQAVGHSSVRATVLDYSVNMATSDYTQLQISMRTLRSLLKVVLRHHPITFLPIEFVLEEMSNMTSVDVTDYKRRLNNLTPMHRFRNSLMLLQHITNCFDTLIEYGYLPNDLLGRHSSEELLSTWAKKERIRQPKGQTYALLEPEEIGSIQNFLKFNKEELTTTLQLLNVLRKLTIFLELKQGDMTDAIQMYRILCRESDVSTFKSDAFSRLLQYNSTVYISNSDQFGGNEPLLNILFLRKCVESLLSKINTLLNSQIPRWWKYYGELLELARHKQSKPNTKGDVVVEDGGVLDTCKFIAAHRETGEEDHGITLKIESLSNEIKSSHIMLAEELSKFMDFKGKFITSGIVKTVTVLNFQSLTSGLAHFLFSTSSKGIELE